MYFLPDLGPKNTRSHTFFGLRSASPGLLFWFPSLFAPLFSFLFNIILLFFKSRSLILIFVSLLVAGYHDDTDLAVLRIHPAPQSATSAIDHLKVVYDFTYIMIKQQCNPYLRPRSLYRRGKLRRRGEEAVLQSRSLDNFESTFNLLRIITCRVLIINWNILKQH